MELTPARRTAAVVAGAALLLMAVLAGAASGAVLAPLAHLPDVEAAARIATGAFVAAVLAFVAVAVLDVVVALALRVVLAPGGALLADVAAALRVVYAAVLVVAVGHLVTAGRLVAEGAPAERAGAEVDAFGDLFSLGLGLFALHLVAVGALAARTPGVPRWLGPVVGVGGLGYLVDTVTAVASPGGGTSLATVTFVGEVVLLGWLLVVGLRRRAAVSV